MLLAVKTVKSDWCVSIRFLLVKSPWVYCLSVLLMLSTSRLYGASSLRKRLTGVSSELVNQLSIEAWQSQHLIL